MPGIRDIFSTKMKIIKKLINRFTIVSLLLLIQIAWIAVVATYLTNDFYTLSVIFTILSVIVSASIINKQYEPEMKLAWIVPILVFPIFGWALYLLFGTKIATRRLRRKFTHSNSLTVRKLPQSKELFDEVRREQPDLLGLTAYLSSNSFPVYKNTSSKYYPLGDDMFPDLLAELKTAEKFIFIEFFIISEGVVWNSVLEILEEKVKAGVDVRVIYDDFGCINYLSSKYYKELEKKGIKCIAFNRYRPFLSVIMNNRDHRKIIAIDGKVAFTGGVNLADEYINRISRFGHWKDAAVMIKGEAVATFTTLFLEMWNYNRSSFDDTEKLISCSIGAPGISDGYVIPYGDSPLDSEIVGENVYLHIISNSKKYLYITTPYLIINSSLNSALILAAKRGVDVRIILPSIPDKRVVYQLTKSHCPALIKAGIKIYNYTPGFMHAKGFVCDDVIATVGSINLDYRSLYLHFECGCIFYKSGIIEDIREDFLTTLEKCEPEKLSGKGIGIFRSFYYALLRLVSPMF